MKKNLPILALLFASSIVFGQKDFYRDRAFNEKPKSIKGHEIICPANHMDVNTYREMPDKVKKAIAAQGKLRPSSVKKATFDVDYIDFPDNAKASFQRAVDIWSELLASDVNIKVIAIYSQLGPNTLGSATAGTFYRNFEGANLLNAWYPIALAEKMAAKDLNSPNDYDVVARFSSDVNWYFGTTGNPAVGQFDFTSVVLHELCHGLGFVGSLDVEGSQGQYGQGSEVPFVFDRFVVNDKNQNLTDTLLFKNPSSLLRNELISESLFFDSPLAIVSNGGTRPKLYAPTIFDAGSSIFHLDDRTYPSGTENSLMTPSAGIREVNYDPGPIVMDIFADMGWKSTSILHNPIKDMTTAGLVKFSTGLRSDTTIIDSTFRLHYLILDTETATRDDVNFANAKSVVLGKEPSNNNWATNLEIVDPTSVVLYYFSVKDNFGKTVTSPATAPDVYWAFETGLEDQWPPLIEYYAPTIVPSGNPISFLANVEDDFEAGIDTVFVRYSINGVTQAPFGLKKYNVLTDNPDFSQGSVDEIAYLAEDGLPALSAGDRALIQVVARDAAGNETVVPTTAGGTSVDDPNEVDFYEIAATSLKESKTKYFTNFDNAQDDFAMIGFDIDTPSGLSNNALNTGSPYKNGLGLSDPVTGRTYLDFDYNAIALFRYPIVVSRDSATISFDEIVLVEPGEEGAAYGEQGFWDYVVVEVSFNGGQSWFELEEGYDSNKETAWRNQFVSTLAPANVDNPTSNGAPSPALYRSHEINIFDAVVEEAAGQEMLLRFRLFADQWVNGAGWFIDNLAIQQPAAKPLAVEKTVTKFTLSPNPAVDFIDVSAGIKTEGVEIEVIDAMGKVHYTESLDNEENQLQYRFATKDLNPGVYFIRIKADNITETRRFVLRK